MKTDMLLEVCTILNRYESTPCMTMVKTAQEIIDLIQNVNKTFICYSCRQRKPRKGWKRIPLGYMNWGIMACESCKQHRIRIKDPFSGKMVWINE